MGGGIRLLLSASELLCVGRLALLTLRALLLRLALPVIPPGSPHCDRNGALIRKLLRLCLLGLEGLEQVLGLGLYGLLCISVFDQTCLELLNMVQEVECLLLRRLILLLESLAKLLHALLMLLDLLRRGASERLNTHLRVCECLLERIHLRTGCEFHARDALLISLGSSPQLSEMKMCNHALVLHRAPELDVSHPSAVHVCIVGFVETLQLLEKVLRGPSRSIAISQRCSGAPRARHRTSREGYSAPHGGLPCSFAIAQERFRLATDLSYWSLHYRG